MSKKPYIPLYVGDWVKDTDCISLEAEGALLKLVFKMWESKTPGSVSIRFSQIAILFKKSEEIARKIVQELKENDILEIEYIGENEVKIENRRMIREHSKSLTNSENGKKGGRPKSEKQKKEKRIETESKANIKRNADNDIDIENDNDIDIENKIEIKSEKNKKTTFRNSKLFDRKIFDLALADWPEEKRNFYFEAALTWSDDNQASKFQSIDWSRRLRQWDARNPWTGGNQNSKTQNFKNGNSNPNQAAFERIAEKTKQALGSWAD